MSRYLITDEFIILFISPKKLRPYSRVKGNLCDAKRNLYDVFLRIRPGAIWLSWCVHREATAKHIHSGLMAVEVPGVRGDRAACYGFCATDT